MMSGNEQQERYRSKQDIKRDILSLLVDMPQLRTRVMYMAFLSYSQLKQYQKDLEADGFIEINQTKWTITQKGRSWLAIVSKAKRMEASV